MPGLLTVLDGVKRASRDWAANNKAPSWLAHSEERLRAAQRLLARPDLAANLEPTDKDYISACAAAERAAQSARRRAKALVGALALLLTAGGVGWWQQTWLWEKYRWHWVMGAEVLTAEKEKEKAAQPKAEFKECTNGCPVMVVLPAGTFMMGSTEREGDHENRPRHEVTIARPFAVGKTEVTFMEWDACIAAGACLKASDDAWGRDDRPVINVSWDDAKEYVAWLSRLSGQDYRLLTEAEWEYAARAGNPGLYSFGDDETQLGDYAWYFANSKTTQPVGKKKANAFGLHDMHGNVWEWVEDCWNTSYNAKPEGLLRTGGAWVAGNCSRRVFRGGSKGNHPFFLGSAVRLDSSSVLRINYVGFRVGRTLRP